MLNIICIHKHIIMAIHRRIGNIFKQNVYFIDDNYIFICYRRAKGDNSFNTLLF